MILHIGKHRVKVVVVANLTNPDDNDAPCLGLCEYGSRQISLSDKLDEAQRRHTLKHEWYHMMIHIWGRAANAEEDSADRFAAASDALDDALALAGGWKSLHQLYVADSSPRLNLIDTRAMAELAANGGAFGEYAYPILGLVAPACPTCGRTPAKADVKSSQPQWSFEHRIHVTSRAYTCKKCEHQVKWREACDELTGHPAGRVLDEVPDVVCV
jgi:hypothetical protein